MATVSGLGLLLAACGTTSKAATAASPAGAASPASGSTAAAPQAGTAKRARFTHGHFKTNAALGTATEIMLVAPVVPFTPSQVAALVPILQSLAKDPTMPAAEVAAKAKQMRGLFTKLQVEAIANLRKSHFSAGTTGAPPTGRHGFPFPHAAAGRTSGDATTHGAAFTPATLYDRAIAVLQGKAAGGFPFGLSRAAPSGGATA